MNNKLTEFGLNQSQGRDHFSVLEHPFLSYNVLFCFRTSFSCFRLSFSALSRFLLCLVPDFGCPSPARPLARFLACPVVPLSRDNDGTSVHLSQKVALSRPVGNTKAKSPQVGISFRTQFPSLGIFINKNVGN